MLLLLLLMPHWLWRLRLLPWEQVVLFQTAALMLRVRVQVRLRVQLSRRMLVLRPRPLLLRCLSLWSHPQREAQSLIVHSRSLSPL